MMLSYKS